MISAIDGARRQLGELISTRRGGRQAGDRQFLVGLLGRGIQASKTPRMHELEGARLGLDYTYVLIDFDVLGLADHDLGAMIDEAEALGFAGLNVTHPFKQAVLPLLDDLAPEAASIGAVNTVVLGGGRRVGHNTDSWGFAESFRQGLGGVSMESIAQFGAGGAGAAVGYALLSLGAHKLTLCETDLDRARRLAMQLGEHFSTDVEFTNDPMTALESASGLVNTTPVGMAKYPGTAFPVDLLRPSHWVAEIIYFPPDTALLQAARALGCRTLAGTGMAVYQAVKAFELFTGIAPDRAAMTGHFRAIA